MAREAGFALTTAPVACLPLAGVGALNKVDHPLATSDLAVEPPDLQLVVAIFIDRL
jgi:hypothetical protein